MTTVILPECEPLKPLTYEYKEGTAESNGRKEDTIELGG